MAVTIKDIAKKLDISVTAVSKALNDRKDISKELKIKVRKVAQELDYTPNSIAKRLVTNKNNTIGLFILSRQGSHIKEETFALRIIAGILDEASKSDYDIVLFSTDSDLLDKKSYIKLCKGRRVAGAIFTGLRLDDPHLNEIKNASFPISIIDTYIEGKNINYISTDNKLGIQKALDHLWELGHRRIAMINGHKNAQVSKLRYNAYKEYLQERGLFDKNLVISSDFTKIGGYQSAIKILGWGKRPTAIFAASDLMAFGVIEAFKENKIKVPQDISIIGFDNIVTSAHIEPKLTTVGQNPFNMGKAAVDLILEHLSGESKKKKIILDPEVIIRDSCSAV